MRRSAHGAGLVFVLVLFIGLLVFATLIGQGYQLSFVAGHVRTSVSADAALLLAESAVEEAHAWIAREANGASGDGSPVFRAFRDPGRKPFSIDVDVRNLKGFQSELARQPLHRDAPARIAARVRFQRRTDPDAVAAHDERFGTMEITATVPYPVGRSPAERSATRWFEMELARPMLPAPFDQTLLYLHHGRYFLERHARVEEDDIESSNALMLIAASTLVSRIRELEDAVKSLDADAAGFERLRSAALSQLAGSLRQAGQQLAGTRQRIIAALQPLRDPINAILEQRHDPRPPHYFLAPLVMYTRIGADAEASLAPEDINLPEIAKKAVDDWKRVLGSIDAVQEELDAARSEVTDALADESLASAAGARVTAAAAAYSRTIMNECQGAVDVLDAYRKFQSHFTERAGTDEAELFDRLLGSLAPAKFVPGPGATPGSIRAAKAQYRIPATGAADPAALRRRLGDLLRRYGPPFQGTVVVDNAGGVPLVLDGAADASWRRFSGRLVLVVTGDCVVREVGRADPKRHLLTVIAGGSLAAGGNVEASLVALRSFARPANMTSAKITGSLVLGRDALDVLEPEKILEGVTLVRDPLLASSSDADGTSRPGAQSVLFTPVPVYARAPRRGP